MIEMRIETEVKSTEDPEKLKKAILNVFPDSEPDFNEEKQIIKGEADFETFWNRAAEQRIREAILEVLKENKRDGETRIGISKTAAFSGKLATDVGSSLGQIKLEISWEEIEELT